MKILFVWRKMDQVAGGVERMITAMMNEMVDRKHDVHLLTWDRQGATPYYHMDERIVWHCLDMGDPNRKAGPMLRLKRMIKVRKIVNCENPDLAMCFENGVFFSLWIYLTGYSIPIIEAERNAPSRLDFHHSKLRKALVFLVLGMADRVTVQFERYCRGYPVWLRRRMVAISNPVRQAEKHAAPKGKAAKTKTLLSVSRLAYQKNIGVLIRAFAELAPVFPDWRLVVAGDGEDENELREMISVLDLEERIVLPGAVKDVEDLYCTSHLFCLPSRWEGFPNGLAEAMAHGLPAVGFAGCSGVCDLIRHGETGLLAHGNDDASSLKSALATLMEDGDRRQSMGEAARKSIAQYKPELIFDRWEALFRETAGRK